jgi:DNA-binding HxlR family transcriptional regulator
LIKAPASFEYDLTPPGRSLEQPIRLIAAQAEQNMPRITRARNFTAGL